MPLLAGTGTGEYKPKRCALAAGRTRRSAPTRGVVEADRRDRPASHPTRFVISVFISLIIALVLQYDTSLISVAAQDPTSTPERVDPTACAIEPRDFEEIADLASTPVPAATSTFGTGTPADPQAVQDVTDTIVIAVACANANDPLRSYALFTDRYLAERFGEGHPDDLGSLFASLSREPVPADEADWLALVEVRDVNALAEGWVEATVVTENQEALYVDHLVLQQVEGRWLIDSWAPVVDEATPTS